MADGTTFLAELGRLASSIRRVILAGVAPTVLCAALSTPAAGAGRGMSISGSVESAADGRVCSDCRVLAINLAENTASFASTDWRGGFRLTDLPAGPYSLLTVDRSGNWNLIAGAFHGPPSTRIEPLLVEDGVNIEGVRLEPPVPSETTTELELAVALTATGLGRATQDQPMCSQGRPDPVKYPPPPDPQSRIVFGARRGPDTAIPPPEDPCDRPTALACTKFSLTHIKTIVPADQLPVCRADGVLIIPTDVVDTAVDFRPPDSPRYNPEPPDGPGCAEIRKQDCGGPPGYHSYNGMKVHECYHRIAVETLAFRLFLEYLDKIKAIQASIDAKGRCYWCCWERQQDAVAAYAAFRAKFEAEAEKLVKDEEPAYEAECEYYHGRYKDACSVP